MEGRNKRDFWAWVSNQFAMRATDPAWGANLKDGRWPACVSFAAHSFLIFLMVYDSDI